MSLQWVNKNGLCDLRFNPNPSDLHERKNKAVSFFLKKILKIFRKY